MLSNADHAAFAEALPVTTDDLQALEIVVDRMRQKLKKSKTFLLEDMEFHRLLYRKLNNRVLLNILEMFWKLFGQIEEGSRHSLRQLSESVNQHQAILQRNHTPDVCEARRDAFDIDDGGGGMFEHALRSIDDQHHPALRGAGD